MNAAFENPQRIPLLTVGKLWGFLRFGMCRCKHRFYGLYALNAKAKSKEIAVLLDEYIPGVEELMTKATAYANQNTTGVWLCRIMWRKVWDIAVKMGLGRLVWGYEF